MQITDVFRSLFQQIRLIKHLFPITLASEVNLIGLVTGLKPWTLFFLEILDNNSIKITAVCSPAKF